MTEPIPGFGAGVVGYQGRGSTSIHRSPVIDVSILSPSPILVLVFHSMDYMSAGLEDASINTTWDPLDTSTSGPDPYADGVFGLVTTLLESAASAERQALVYDTLAYGGALAPTWGTSPGWPTPPHGGLPDYTWIAQQITDFEPDLLRDGTTRNLDIVMQTATVGSAELNGSVDAPALTLPALRRNALVFRGVLTNRPTESTVFDVGTSLSAVESTYTPWEKSPAPDPRTLGALGTEERYFVVVDNDHTTGGDLLEVPAYPNIYTSAQTSEEVMVLTGVLSYPQSVTPSDPVLVDSDSLDLGMLRTTLEREIEPIDTNPIDPPLEAWVRTPGVRRVR